MSIAIKPIPIVRSLLITALSIVITALPAMADCGWRSKASECNGYGGDADDYGGCSVETSDAWYNIKINGGRISGEKVCSKYPPVGYCGCSDYGIY